MSQEMAIDIAYLVIFTSAKISAPIMMTAIVVGILINVIQTVTSIRDMSLTFVPKVVVAAVVVGLALPWMIGTMTSLFVEVYQMFSQIHA